MQIFFDDMSNFYKMEKETKEKLNNIDESMKGVKIVKEKYIETGWIKEEIN